MRDAFFKVMPWIAGLLLGWMMWHPPAWLESLFVLPWLALVLAPLQVLAAARVWRDAGAGWVARVHHLVVVLSAGLFLAFSYLWRLYAGMG